MFLFLKLYLAHLIADFILQFDALYRLKVKAFAGHVYHVLIVVGVSLILVAPYLRDPFMWVLVGAISSTHLFQDLAKYSLQKKNPNNIFWYFIFDQTLHFLITASVLFFPISGLTLDWPALGPLNSLYASNQWTLRAILFVMSAFGGAYFLHAFRRSFFPSTREKHFITKFELAHGALERSWISFLWLCPHWSVIFLIPIIGFVRFFSKRLKSMPDFLLSFSYATLLGFAFRFFLRG